MARAAMSTGRLKELLESTKILKLCYDCRSDADAVFHQYGVTLTNLYDLQVAYCLKRDRETSRPDKFLKGLAHAIDNCPNIKPAKKAELSAIKHQGQALFVPEQGGSYGAWKRRPMHQILVQYAAADVTCLFDLFDADQAAVPRGEMRKIASQRVHQTIYRRSAARGQHMAKKDFVDYRSGHYCHLQ
jgi:exonuclease 3'-5' domain-containing protein 1